MSIVSNLLNKLVEKHDKSVEFQPLDLAIQVVEKFDLGTECLKSTYRNEFSKILENIFENELSKVNESDDEFAGILSGLLFDDLDSEDMDEKADPSKSALKKPYPYHNMFSRPVGNSYSPIKSGRDKGGKYDVSTLQLGDNKFMDFKGNDKHWSDLQKYAMTMKDPREAMIRIKRALVNLMVNFKNSRQDIVRRAKAVLRYIFNLAKPQAYIDRYSPKDDKDDKGGKGKK